MTILLAHAFKYHELSVDNEQETVLNRNSVIQRYILVFSKLNFEDPIRENATFLYVTVKVSHNLNQILLILELFNCDTESVIIYYVQ